MLKPPPLLLGAALIFWGWRTGFLVVSIVGAVLLEIVHLISGRWNFSDKEFNRLWDVCTFVFVSAGIYLRYSEEVTDAAYKFFQWFPLIFYPMALGHIYSSRDGVPIKAFSWFMRRKGREGADRPIAFGWIYLVVCLATAGASNLRDYWFYVVISALTGWALFSIRPLRLPVWGWAAVFALLAGGGFFAQQKMPDMQAAFENRVSEFFLRFAPRQFDPREARTAMGQIGELAQSSRIVMKVRPEDGPVPALLRQATYYRLEGTTWRGTRQDYGDVPIEPDLTTWTLHPETNTPRSVRIIQRLSKRSALLSIPLGTSQLRELSVVGVSTNAFSVVRVTDNPALANFTAHFGAGQTDPISWGRRNWDLHIPEEEAEAVEKVAGELALLRSTHHDLFSAIPDYFAKKFSYTTFQKAREMEFAGQTPLTYFLLQSRAGHCEYFASATVLLLRHFGIPARYVTGYSVQESQEDEAEGYVVRERHAHAWAVAFDGERWVEVDSTPGGWAAQEAAESPFFQPALDAWEWLTFSFLEWRWLGQTGFFATLAPWLLAPLILFLGWRVFGRRMVRQAGKSSRWKDAQGTDSEFYLLEKKLRRLGLQRHSFETPAQWGARVGRDKIISALPLILRLHYKYRFDPEGLAPEEREQLKTLVRASVQAL